MDAKGLLADNFPNYENIDRGMYSSGMNPFTGYQITQKYSQPYQFPAASDANIFSLGGSNFDSHGFPQVHDPSHGFGLKYGGTGYGHSGSGGSSPQTHGWNNSPPMMQGGKGGKLKGAALSALTLLAFLFFLNLLQTCLKDQMDTMNPTVK